jgi:cytoskeletal protein CcmA (bactofilin family)
LAPENGKAASPITLLAIVGNHARMEGKLVIGEKGVVSANIQTVDAIIMGQYEGNMVATGNVEIAETGRASGNIQTDSLVISKGGFFNGNVTKMNEAPSAARQVVSLEEKRAGQQDLQR